MALLLLLFYAANIIGGAAIGTCTQGDDERFVISLIMNVPTFILALICILLVDRWLILKRINFVLLIGIATLTTYLCGPLFIQSSINGHHLCGEEYSVYNYVGEDYTINRLIPVFQFLSTYILFLLAWWKLKTHKKKEDK